MALTEILPRYGLSALCLLNFTGTMNLNKYLKVANVPFSSILLGKSLDIWRFVYIAYSIVTFCENSSYFRHHGVSTTATSGPVHVNSQRYTWILGSHTAEEWHLRSVTTQY